MFVIYDTSPCITKLFGFTTVTEGLVPKAPVWLAVTTATLLNGIISVEEPREDKVKTAKS